MGGVLDAVRVLYSIKEDIQKGTQGHSYLCGQLGQGFRTPEQPAATGNDERDERN